MRVRSLDLIRYGHFTEASLHIPSEGPDFHIVYGENEAGKSTTMSAIEELLFGIPGRLQETFFMRTRRCASARRWNVRNGAIDPAAQGQQGHAARP